MKPVPRDDNGHPLVDRGTELFTQRIASLGTDMSGLALPIDFKEVMFHVESGPEVLHLSGTVEGSSTARLTVSGFSWTVPVIAASGHTIVHVAAPSGTCNVSIFAWR
ncbi:MAG: hypothetical protein HY912_02965 [Desulfomonile tiedjei]|uniref:Uncharacterized protein n=1 Tax=Desulfomonile tiedjei TaxID=2358 RepID=A0A9D6V0E5_9BACT|nr:hypothetical protein [Desulfomonile tiedjei]